jgi:hypothetical protein
MLLHGSGDCMSRYIDFYENKFYYDSSIDTQRMVGPQDPFEFFLLFRLNLERLNPPDKQKTGVVSDHDGRQVPILRWDDDAWLHFTRKYVKSVMDVWDKAFLLIPPAKYDGTWTEGDAKEAALPAGYPAMGYAGGRSSIGARGPHGEPGEGYLPCGCGTVRRGYCRS